MRQSSRCKEAGEGRKNRVWAMLWEINSTAFHQVEILALHTHRSEPGLNLAPVDICQITKFDPIGLPYHREDHCWNGRWCGRSEPTGTAGWQPQNGSTWLANPRAEFMLQRAIFIMHYKQQHQSRLAPDFLLLQTSITASSIL